MAYIGNAWIRDLIKISLAFSGIYIFSAQSRRHFTIYPSVDQNLLVFVRLSWTRSTKFVSSKLYATTSIITIAEAWLSILHFLPNIREHVCSLSHSDKKLLILKDWSVFT